MSPIIRVHCPGCNTDLTLEPYEVLLRIGPDPDDAGYRFICRWCGARVDYSAPPLLVSILRDAGVSILEVTDPEKARAVPDALEPISEAEARAFIIDLAVTDTPQDELTTTD